MSNFKQKTCSVRNCLARVLYSAVVFFAVLFITITTDVHAYYQYYCSITPIYTSCKSGYQLVGTNCVPNGGGGGNNNDCYQIDFHNTDTYNYSSDSVSIPFTPQTHYYYDTNGGIYYDNSCNDYVPYSHFTVNSGGYQVLSWHNNESGTDIQLSNNSGEATLNVNRVSNGDIIEPTWQCQANYGFSSYDGSCTACPSSSTESGSDSTSGAWGSCTRSKSRSVSYSSSGGRSACTASYGSWSYGNWSCSCNTGYHYTSGSSCDPNVSGAISLDSNFYYTYTNTNGGTATITRSVDTNGAPATVYIKYNTGVYSNSAATTAITRLSTNPSWSRLRRNDNHCPVILTPFPVNGTYSPM